MTLAANHYNPEQWVEPEKFIPERFDPNHDYFMKPGTSDARDSTSFIPFSWNMRKCPGQLYAILELKLMVAYLVCRADYEVIPEIMTDYSRYFGIEADQVLPGKITKIFHN